MKTRYHLLLLSCIGLLFGCNQPETQATTECHKDSILSAYIADTAFYPQEDTLIEKQIGFVASQIQTLSLPEEWKGNDMFEKMVTFYNTMEILHAIETDYDAYMRYSDGNPNIDETEEHDSADLKTELMNELHRISFESIADTVIRERILTFIDQIEHEQGDDEATDSMDISDIIENLTESWIPVLPDDSVAMEAFIAPAFPNHHLPDNTPDVFEDYVGQEASPTTKDADNIVHHALNDKDFCAKTAWAFVALGLKMAGADYNAIEADSIVLIETENMLASGNYSPMLDPLWRAYRIKYNSLYTCPSSWCYSPNLRYNHYRRMIAYTTLRHIEAHPEDDLAKIQYYFLAMHSNIIRFNPYPFGNSSGYEFMNLYWNQGLLGY